MKRRTLPFLFVLSVVLAASPVFAQARLTVELRGGGNVATEQFANVDLEPRAGLEGGVGLRVAPDLYLYGAWDWQQHRSKTPLFGVIADIEDTGYAFGLRYVAPVASRAKPWVRAGGLYNHVEIEDSNAGSLVADSEHTFGFEVGGGLELALNDAWSLTPGVRYRRFEPEVRRGSVRSPATLSYVTVIPVAKAAYGFGAAVGRRTGMTGPAVAGAFGWYRWATSRSTRVARGTGRFATGRR